MAAVADEKAAADLAVRVADTSTKVAGGRQGVLALAAAGCDMVLNALVGIAGLEPTILAAEAGSDNLTVEDSNPGGDDATHHYTIDLAKDIHVNNVTVDNSITQLFFIT